MRYPLCPECGAKVEKGYETCVECGLAFYVDYRDRDEKDDVNVFASLRDHGPQSLLLVAASLSGLYPLDLQERRDRAYASLRRLMARGYVVSDARGFYALTFAAAQRGRL